MQAYIVDTHWHHHCKSRPTGLFCNRKHDRTVVNLQTKDFGML